jgi:c-di-GMP-binding flagellar brake protein YcgR
MSADDRRKDFRADLRTVVNIYTAESRKTSPPPCMRGWSEDVSATGARLVTNDPIVGSRVWLKFIGQGQGDCFIEADVVRTESVSHSQFRSDRMMYSYGVRFRQLMTESEFLELALDQVERLTAGLQTVTPAPKALAVG